MTNNEKYVNAFVEVFSVEPEDVEKLEYQSIIEWDSVGHMSLMAELEDSFDIMMELEDIIEFANFEKGKEILGRYDVELE